MFWVISFFILFLMFRPSLRAVTAMEVNVLSVWNGGSYQYYSPPARATVSPLDGLRTPSGSPFAGFSIAPAGRMKMKMPHDFFRRLKYASIFTSLPLLFF